jgi:hypothetical protein
MPYPSCVTSYELGFDSSALRHHHRCSFRHKCDGVFGSEADGLLDVRFEGLQVFSNVTSAARKMTETLNPLFPLALNAITRPANPWYVRNRKFISALASSLHLAPVFSSLRGEMSSRKRSVEPVNDTRLASIISSIANLKEQLCELRILRDQVRKAELSARRSRSISDRARSLKQSDAMSRRQHKYPSQTRTEPPYEA